MKFMSKIEDFYNNATDKEWDEISAEREKIRLILNKDEQKKAETEFKNNYGFYPESIRCYEVMHYVELKKRCESPNENNKELQEENEKLKAEIERLKANKTTSLQWRKINGTPAKSSIYSTKEAIELYNKAVNWIENEYGCKRCFASAFVLEEGIKRLEIPDENAQIFN